MLSFGLNHMTVAKHSFAELLGTAAAIGAVGVELRNDLPQPLFDGLVPEAAKDHLAAAQLRLLALAEVKRFNDWSPDKRAEALALMKIARAAGAEAVSLIPRNDNLGMGNGERQAHLRVAMRDLKPMLEDHDLIGLIEPLGFAICALRHKSEAVEAIEALAAKGRFRLIHDTFHHFLAGCGPIFPDHTGLVHISGVTTPAISADEMTDAHRVLVGPHDRMGNTEQITALMAGGYSGVVSFEAFAPQTHDLVNPIGALTTSIEFIHARLAEKAA